MKRKSLKNFYISYYKLEFSKKFKQHLKKQILAHLSSPLIWSKPLKINFTQKNFHPKNFLNFLNSQFFTLEEKNSYTFPKNILTYPNKNDFLYLPGKNKEFLIFV